MKQSKIEKYRQSEEILLKEYTLKREEHFVKVEGYGIGFLAARLPMSDPGQAGLWFK